MLRIIDKLWYGKHPLQWVLLPLSWVFTLTSVLRRAILERFFQVDAVVPVIVVGNVTAGGVGKTPLVIELAKQMQQKGMRVGIVSRGYGAQMTHFPYEVQLQDTAQQVGDEPLLMAKKTGCPVVIAPQRNKAVAYLVKHHAVQIIISDDGLQHYKMGRAIEIAVIDGSRGLGNGLCIPAGPLREPPRRLDEVDFLVVNGGEWKNAHPMHLTPGKITHLISNEEIPTDLLSGTIAAIAAIGNPQRFYDTLREMGVIFNTYSFPDHYQFKPYDLNYAESLIIMTEKDAVKCRSFGSDKMYYLPVSAVLNDAFWDALWSHQQLKGFC